MRGSWFYGLVVLGVGSIAAIGRGQEVLPLPSVNSSTDSAPVVSLGRPVVRLGRPVARKKKTTTTAPSLLPVAYKESASDITAPTPTWPDAHLKGQQTGSGFAADRGGSSVGGSELSEEKKEPVTTLKNPPTPIPAPVSGDWSQNNPVVGMPHANGVVGNPVVGGPVTGDPIIGGPVVGGPVVGDIGGPIVDGSGAACFSDAYAGGGSGPRFYAGLEYLLWWLEDDDQVPALASTSTNQNDFGFLDRASTVALFNRPVDRDAQSGGRFTIGTWLGQNQAVGLETTWFFLGERRDSFFASSNDFPVLARPFFAVDQGTEFSELVAFPGVGTGDLVIDAPSRLYGGEINLRRGTCSPLFSKLDCLAGVRFLDLSEGIFITENINALMNRGFVQQGARIRVQDSFQTHNEFYGAQVGLQGEIERGRWSLNLLGKIALGVTHQTATVNGFQSINNPDGSSAQFQGGLLALSSNIGRRTQNKFAVVPEVGATLGYRLCNCAKLTVGYSFLYWSSVLRPGGTIDRNIDANLVPNFLPNPVATGLNRPAPRLDDTGLWISGLNFGLELNF